MSLSYKRVYLKRRVGDKWACFVCGAKFRIKRDIRSHEHWQVAKMKHFYDEYPRSKKIKDSLQAPAVINTKK